jgi:hypothetical protein
MVPTAFPIHVTLRKEDTMQNPQLHKLFIVLTTFIVSACVPPVTRADLLWDGVGTPDSSAFNVHDEAGYLQFDTPQPGTMYYNTLNHAGAIGSGGGYFSMRTDVASAELSYLDGWSWETRVYVVQNVPKPGLSWREYHGAAVGACDGVRDTCVFLRPNGIELAGIPTLGSYQYDAPGYHTIRFEAPPESSQVDVFVDGEKRISVAYTFASEHPVGLSFGDASSNSDGEAYWDYLSVGVPVPEPGTAASGAIGLLFVVSVILVRKNVSARYAR